MADIHEVLKTIQFSLKAPKGQYNSFGKYSYRSCEDILEAVKPLLAENGATLTISDEIVQIGDRYYVKATACLNGADGGSKSVCGFAREEAEKKGMDGSQVTGAASSYARKYALNGLFCIDDTKDSDATNDHGKSKPKQTDADPLAKRLNSEYVCDKCGKPFEPATYKGKEYTAAQLYFGAVKKYGSALCKECAKEVNNA